MFVKHLTVLALKVNFVSSSFKEHRINAALPLEGYTMRYIISVPLAGKHLNVPAH